MKIKIFLTLLAIISLAGCKQQDDLAAKKQQLEELKKQQENIHFQIMELEKEILSNDSTALTEKKKGKLITTFTVAEKPFTSYIEIQGNAESDQNVAVSAEMGGRVTDIAVEDGDVVQKGQLLVKLDDDLIVKQIEDVRVSYDLAVTVFQKQESLWKKNIGSEIQYLEAKNGKETLEKKLQTLQTQLEKTRIKAPVSGTVELIRIKQGETAAPGFPLLNVVNLDLIKVKADMPERYIASVKKGGEVVIAFPSLGIEKKAVVASAGNIINPSNRTFRVEVEIPNKDHALKANLLALIKLSEYQNPKALTIPTRIILRENNQDFVYVVAQNSEPVAQKRSITAGKSYGGETEILSGLTQGEALVNEGFQYVTDGAVVEIQK